MTEQVPEQRVVQLRDLVEILATQGVIVVNDLDPEAIAAAVAQDLRDASADEPVEGFDHEAAAAAVGGEEGGTVNGVTLEVTSSRHRREYAKAKKAGKL